MIFKNKIFNNTLLEGINFNLYYAEEGKPKPVHLYALSKDYKSVTVSNYYNWHRINYYKGRNDIFNMFLHDICHCILYFKRKSVDEWRLFTDDFGLSFNDMHFRYLKCDNYEFNKLMIFDNYDEMIDEYYILGLQKYINYYYTNKQAMLESEYHFHMTRMVENIFYKEDKFDTLIDSTRSLMSERIRQSWNFWNFEQCINRSLLSSDVYYIIRKFVEYTNLLFTKAAY